MSKRDEIVALASQEVGYKEYANNKTKYGEWYGVQGEWCDIFVSWCAYQTGILNTLIPKEAYVPNTANWYKRKGLLRSKGYKPSKGDLIFFDHNRNGSPDHIGIVSNFDGTKITTIEGNKSKAVKRCTYTMSYKYIYGIAVVEYKDDPKEESINTVKEVQHFLNEKYGSGLAEDNKYGKLTKKALIKAVQKELKITVDGIWGNQTKSAFPNITLGTKGPITKLVQCSLICHKYDLAADGIYGQITKEKVVDFQKWHLLKKDGIVGKNTATRLFK